ncbi:hypothetical protein DZF91_16900 [Actinomadura logoneensis]|uniref:Uncharacterized protein n=1 Tax=Actinomadura logoneensis TaxID=2293572 RepID=A0A372JL06_9ACTN|nr:hypothetical protein [Actinomadura logoneensis]RFU40496.1 hypothetical protein DZF91_16900 [Actinomadura logoneensis]
MTNHANLHLAYEEAMRRHGLLSGTISLISGYARENLTVMDEISGPDDSDLSGLEKLRDAIEAAGSDVKTSFRPGPDGRLLLHVNNPDIGGRFCEDISIRDVPHYHWSWGEPLAPVATPDVAAARIVHVLNVGGLA